MSINDFYGSKSGTTYLEIFTEPDDGSEKVTHRLLRDQEAYDTWHLSFYFKEILDYRRLLEAPSLSLDDLPRKEKGLLLYLMLASDRRLSRVLELGSTLFEMIDGFELVKKYRERNASGLPDVDLEALTYVGIELSEMFRRTAPMLYPGYRIEQYEHVEAFSGKTADLLFDRSVSNYAFQTAQEFAAFVGQSRVAFLNTYFSFGETFISSRLGKSLTYFSRDEFLSYVDKPVYHLFGTRAPGPHSGQDLSLGRPVVEGFFLCCEPDFAETFMALSKTDPAVKAYFSEKDIKLTSLSELKPGSF